MNLVDELRKEKREAIRHLEEVKSHKVKRWDKESFAHWAKRMNRHRRRRKRIRHIAEGYDHKIRQARQRREERREKNRDRYSPNGGGVVPFDDTVDGVVEWIAYELTVARNAGWNGRAFSGYRSPAKSVSICYDICGAPSCPGRCAGASSNHARSGNGGGAADCTDASNLERICYQKGLRLRNNLPADLPHMSATGF